MKVAVSQTINCAHQLPGTEMHGHTYRVTVMFAGKLLSDGLVLRLETLRNVLMAVLKNLDHMQLETVIGQPATAERLALYVKRELSIEGCSVRVEVGDDGWVETE